MIPGTDHSALFAQWTRAVRTTDGLEFTIRPLRADDREREVEFVNSMSERTRYMRLLAPLRFLPPHLLEQFMDIDYDRRMALVAVVDTAGREAFAGLARYGATDRPRVVEVALTVTDVWQRHGIARLLLLELMRYARSRGFEEMTGTVLPENVAMLTLARSVGFKVSLAFAERLMRIDFDLRSAETLPPQEP